MPPSTPQAAARTRAPRLRRVLRGVLAAAVVLAVVAYAGRSFVSIYTNALWFHSVHQGSVYSRQLVTQIVLFVLFAPLTTAVVAASLWAVVRRRGRFSPHPTEQRLRYQFSRLRPATVGWLVALVSLYVGVSMGARAAGGWQTWLLWRNAVPFGRVDPQFHRDVSYFVFVYPLHRMVLTWLFRIVLTAVVATVVGAYLSGGLRVRGTGPRMARSVQAQLSLLLGVYLVLKALGYWLDRFGLASTQHGVVTGVSYTDAHVLLPDKLVLLVVASLLALVLLANVAVRRLRLLLIGVAGMAVAAFVFGVAVPGLVQQFTAKPSASTVELPYIARNITATREAFGLGGQLTSRPYGGSPAAPSAALRRQADAAAQVRLLDPNRMSPTFTGLQQERAFYGFKSTLDVDRYPVAGRQQDVLLAVRELQQNGLPSSQRTWTNTHLVYTHGYGVVAAPTDTAAGNQPPAFVEGGVPATGALGSFVPQIYYGQMSPSYSIVGGGANGPHREFDHPVGGGASPAYTTHVGGGGVPIGSWFNRLVYGVKLASPSIWFSSEVNSHSQLLTVRDPRSRVAKVAPWLTLDGDAYPVVAGGRILWVVDGYTTSSSYPDSQEQNLRGATTTTLTTNGSTVAQPSTSVNYIRNSVKATVDAYSGKVTLYAWNGSGGASDPLLTSWEHAFPGLVHPQSEIPATLLPHLRYPQDMFDLQRTVLTKYHVTSAQDFYSGSDFWKVSPDPTMTSTTTTNALGKTVSVAPASQPATYMTLSADGTAPATFALSSPLVSLNLRNLAAFVSVDSQPGPGYGSFTLLQMQSGQSVEGPSQIENDIESDPKVAQQLTLLRGGNSKVVLGNLLTIPLGGQLMYAEPIYTRSVGVNTYPTFQKVVIIYGNGTPAYASTLTRALDRAVGSPAAAPAR